MKSPKTYALILLALTTIGGAGLAWQQYQELVELRAVALDKDERAAMKKRMADLERQNQELQDQLAAMQDGSGDNMGDGTVAVTGGQTNRGGFQGGRGGRGGNQQQQAAMQALLARPEVQALLAVQQKARFENTYGNLFKNLNLSSAQRNQVESLLADRQATMQDVLAAARDQGINPRTDQAAFRKLVADAQNSINDNLKSVLGDTGFAQLQNYEQTMPERNVVNQLQQRLSYSDTPLTSAQAEQLVQILAANSPQQGANGAANQNGGGRGGFGGRGGGGGFAGGPGGGLDIGGGGIGGGGGGGGGGTVAITSTAISQAQSVLAGNQLAALQQLQQQQQTQQQLRQIVTAAEAAARNANNATTTTGASGGTTNTGGATTGGGRRRAGGG